MARRAAFGPVFGEGLDPNRMKTIFQWPKLVVFQ